MSVQKKFFVLLTVFFVVFSCAACGASETQAVIEMTASLPIQNVGPGVESIQLKIGVGGDSEWQEGIQLCKLNYGSVKLTDAYQDLYPELADAIENYSESEINLLYESYYQMLPDAKEQAECGAFFGPYEINENVAVRRADSIVTSLLYSGYYYSGGAHGSPYYYGVNFDSHTGEQLHLSDIVTDGTLLEQRVMEALNYWYSDVAYFEGNPMEGYYTDLDDMYHYWTLDQMGLTLYYNVYELAPYSEGAQIVTIPFKGNEDLFIPGWEEIPESYVTQMTLSVPYYTDVDHDGYLDCINLSSWQDEYETYNSLYITVNGQSAQQELFAFSLLPVIVHTSLGADVLCVQVTAENDYCSMYNYTFGENRTVNSAGAFNVGFDSEIDEAETVRYMQVLPATDSNLWLNTRIWLLSTVSGEKCYFIGEDGALYTYDHQYYLNYPMQFTLKKALEGYVVDEVSLKAEDVIESCAAGSVVEWIRTDGAESADLQLPNGVVIRVYVDRNEWPYTISGINIEDIFEGLFFAG